jgi:hypothetical protein
MDDKTRPDETLALREVFVPLSSYLRHSRFPQDLNLGIDYLPGCKAGEKRRPKEEEIDGEKEEKGEKSKTLAPLQPPILTLIPVLLYRGCCLSVEMHRAAAQSSTLSE